MRTADLNKKKKKKETDPTLEVAKHAGACKQAGAPLQGWKIEAAKGNPRKQRGLAGLRQRRSMLILLQSFQCLP